MGAQDIALLLVCMLRSTLAARQPDCANGCVEELYVSATL